MYITWYDNYFIYITSYEFPIDVTRHIINNIYNTSNDNHYI